jgi:hypothetical protein
VIRGCDRGGVVFRLLVPERGISPLSISLDEKHRTQRYGEALHRCTDEPVAREQAGKATCVPVYEPLVCCKGGNKGGSR